MNRCDLVRADSLATAWLPEILGRETEALAGQIEETHTWNGSSDLIELQRALGGYLGPRDIPATRALLSRMRDEGAIGHVLFGFIQTAPTITYLIPGGTKQVKRPGIRARSPAITKQSGRGRLASDRLVWRLR